VSEANKQAAVKFEQSKADEINGPLAEHDMKSFWKCWNSKYQKHVHTSVSVNGTSDSSLIANDFNVKLLFSMMIGHSYVPEAFGYGVIIPIIKDKCGNGSSPFL